MKKILKIRFTKFERALAMQVLEQHGLPERKVYGFVQIECMPEMKWNRLHLRGREDGYNWDIEGRTFKSNDERDSYLDRAVKAITEELFADEAGGLKIGEMCEVSDDGESDTWTKRTLLAVIPEGFEIEGRYVTKSKLLRHRCQFWEYARPLGGSVEPVVKLLSDGDAVYTWESEAGND